MYVSKKTLIIVKCLIKALQNTNLGLGLRLLNYITQRRNTRTDETLKILCLHYENYMKYTTCSAAG